MNIGRLVIVVTAALFSAKADSIDHDKVQPFPQLQPVTASEKAGLEFKPKLYMDLGCVSYPAVNAAGEPSRGLKGTGGSSGCEGPVLGSQVYARAEWYNDVWAIMYAWYFPKGFWDMSPFWRHDWSNAVVSAPMLKPPNVFWVSLSTSENKNGNKYAPAESIGNDTTPLLHRYLPSYDSAELRGLNTYSDIGAFQDLIMWDQLTDAARATLNDQDNFGRTEVPISDDHFLGHLEKAWPF